MNKTTFENVETNNEKNSLITKEMKEKYDGKRVRISRYVYKISLEEDFGTFMVYLYPITSGATATNKISYDGNSYQLGGNIFRKAVELAHDIADEIENNIPVDYIIKSEDEQ